MEEDLGRLGMKVIAHEVRLELLVISECERQAEKLGIEKSEVAKAPAVKMHNHRASAQSNQESGAEQIGWEMVTHFASTFLEKIATSLHPA